ncbi:lactonase family protein [Gemella cuniculi]|uniref:lactonase family protein n=1 Tax=Gemella cuniculi TaxID=150240 RepID=UPI00040091BF|nr:lactonase family protein [Gemella cuniculi]
MVRAYIGTYTKKESLGIYKIELNNNGKVLEVKNVAQIENPTYLAFSKNNKNLYSISKIGEKGAVTSFEVLDSGELKELSSISKEGNPPCYVEVSKDDKTLLSANYHMGEVDSYEIDNVGALSKLVSTDKHSGSGVHSRQEKPHVHFSGFSPTGEYVFTCDLGTDEITTYRLERNVLNKLYTVKVKEGSGVRHMVFSSDETKVFVMTELTSEIIAFDYNGKGKLSNPEYYSTLPKDFKEENKGSAIKISKDNRFIYISNRGQDAIVVFENNNGVLIKTQTISTYGKDPRDFSLDREGNLAIATNETSGTITVYKVDTTSGKLSVVEKGIKVPEAVCVQFK